MNGNGKGMPQTVFVDPLLHCAGVTQLVGGGVS